MHQTMPPRRPPSTAAGYTTRRVGLVLAALMTIAVGALIAFGVWNSRQQTPPNAREVISDLGAPQGSVGPAPELNRGDVIDLLETSEQGRVPLYTQTGELGQVLSYDRFEPQQGGRFHVGRPRALVRMNDGRTIEIRADEADFVRRQSNREPESGRFRGDVELHVLDAELREDMLDDPDWRPTPTLSIFTTTLDFDSVVGEIRMDDAVRLEAPGVRFDGEGVTIVFSERDRRLLYLRLARSSGVTIDPAGANQSGPASTAASSGGAPTAPDLAPARQDFYRADFIGPVLVSSGSRTMESERLELWARLLDGRLPPDAITPIEWRSPGAESPDSERAAPADAEPAPAEPIRITWSGPLEIRPLQGAPRELNIDDLFVRFAAPQDGLVRLTDPDLDATLSGALLEYGATSRLLTITGLGPQGVIARLADRAEALTQRLELDAGSATITAPGPGLIRAVGAGLDRSRRDESGQSPPRDLSWRGRSEIQLAVDSSGAVTVEEARFFDQALARDGDTTASGDSILARFEPADDGSPSISQITLDGSARADAGADGTIAANRLDVIFAPGRPGENPVPTLATATGAVSAQREDVRLRADLVEATLTPDATGDPEVSLLTADLGVIVEVGAGAEAIEARADHLRALPLEEIVELSGEPSQVRRANATIRAPSLRLEGGPRRLTVFGAGSAEQTAESGGDVLGYDHVRVDWSRSMTFDDAAGRTECVGDVVIVAEIGDATVDTARAERLIVDFTPGAAEGETPTGEAARVIGATLLGMSEEIDGGAGAEIEGRRYIADATQDTGRRLETMVFLSGSRILVQAEQETMIVPGAGRLLVEDRRENPDGGGAQPALARGTTHFEWDGSLELNRRTGVGVMDRAVRLRQRPPGAEEVAEMEAESLEAVFSEVAQRLLRAEANGAVYLRHRARQVTADRMLYDALTGVARLEGRDDNVVTYFDEQRGATQTAGAITWDLTADDIKVDRAGPITIPR